MLGQAVFDMEADGLVGALDPVIAAAVDVERFVRLGPLVFQDGQRLARLQRPGPRPRLSANANRRERKARGGRVDRP